MKEKDYNDLLKSIDDSLRLLGPEPVDSEKGQQVFLKLKKIRETIIRVRRDSLDGNVKRDSRSQLGA